MNTKNALWTIIVFLLGGFILFLVLGKNTFTVVPKENIPSTSTTASYSLAQVAKHTMENDCWTIVDGKVYNITSFVATHPAGVEKIMRGCGIDSTSMFTRVGAHNISQLASAFVGLVKN